MPEDQSSDHPSTKHTPCVLIIRDGWGENPNPEHDAFNAIKIADTPVADRLMREYPNTLIRTSGVAVGLLDGFMGNSEVGHQNIGAGRIVDQDSVRITKACRSGAVRNNQVLLGAFDKAKRTDRYVHLMGICSDAGVHGLIEHLFALLDMAKALGCTKIALHLFTDGRDTGPFSAINYVRQVQTKLDELGVGHIASVIGRYWAMDRDNRWERVERAYACLTGQGARKADLTVSATAAQAVQAYYDNPTNDSQRGDEFIPPAMIGEDVHDALTTRIATGDSVIYFNFRGDRPRELVSAFVLDEFYGHMKSSPDTDEKGFKRTTKIPLTFVGMTPYAEFLVPHIKVAFPRPEPMLGIVGAHLASLGLEQFRCAETEKFPHVTFFFNDYRDDPFEGEHRAIIQSPKVATYDLQPEMSARGVCDAVLARLDANDCEPFIVVNFANADMVGHTGKLDAVVKACETVDALVGEIIDKTLRRGGSAIVTADHGNAEQTWSPENDSPHTAHTTYDVPLIVVGEPFKARTLRSGGVLGDIVPTMFDIMGLDKHPAMTGTTLLD